jgi:uncharacterized phage-associated protein
VATYDAVHVSNAILKRFFDAGADITPSKLYTVLYLVTSEYMKTTNAKLLHQRFEMSPKGPVISSVSYKFDSYKKSPIRKYAKDAAGKAYMAKDKALKKVLDKVIPAVLDVPFNDLRVVHHMENSAWRKNHNAFSQHIPDDDVRNDTEYRAFLGMRHFA